MVFTLYELPMTVLDGEDVPRPRRRAVFGWPSESGAVREVWVKKSGSGGQVLCVLWADRVAEDEDAR